MRTVNAGTYNATPPTVDDTGMEDMQIDVNGNQKTTLATALDPTNDGITAYPKGTTAVPLTASGQILSAPGQIVGFYVNSTSAGTIRFSNALTATTPYLGGAITPAVGYHAFPSDCSIGGYATITATLDVTVFVIAEPV